MKKMRAFILPLLFVLGFTPYHTSASDFISEAAALVVESEVEENFQEEDEPSVTYENDSIVKAKDGGYAILPDNFSFDKRVAFRVSIPYFQVERRTLLKLPLFILYCCLKVDC